MDNMTPRERSAQMALVRSRHTKPERSVRRIVGSLGHKYKLHGKKLPGRPDLVFVGKKKVIFVNGCFWHGHKCALGRVPKTRIGFWTKKILGNGARDKKNVRRLAALGWRSLTIWECDVRKKSSQPKMIHKIKMFLK